MRIRILSLLALLLTLGLSVSVVACSDDEDDNNGSDVSDTASDGEEDAEEDTPDDTGDDTSEDMAADTGDDTGDDTAEDTGDDTGDDMAMDTEEDMDPMAPTFTEIYTTIIDGTCNAAGCHGGGAGNLDMSNQTDAYDNLVGVAAAGGACSSTGQNRVEAGDSAASILWVKVNGGPDLCGSQMPLAQGPLSSTEVDMIAAWIDAGAAND